VETLDKQLQRAKQEIDHLSKTSLTEAGQANALNSAPLGATNDKKHEELVDAINQIFSLFRINYHNQFYAAFNDSETLNQAKRMWLNACVIYQTETLLRSAKTVIESSEYLPTLYQFLQHCDELQFQLPLDRNAYLEACNAADRLDRHEWSHPAVYHAGKATGWHSLRSLPEKQVFPIFKEQMEKQKELLRKGVLLDVPQLAAPASNNYQPLPVEEQKRRLARVREELGLG